MKLDSIIENQKEILLHLRHQNVGIERTCDRDLDDSPARPMNACIERSRRALWQSGTSCVRQDIGNVKKKLFLQHIQSCRNLLCNTISFILDFSPGNI